MDKLNKKEMVVVFHPKGEPMERYGGYEGGKPRASDSYSYHCPDCNERLHRKYHYCPMCGVGVVSYYAPNTCRNCGARKHKTPYCGFCGHKHEDVTTPPQKNEGGIKSVDNGDIE
jgi:hypothetical protein